MSKNISMVHLTKRYGDITIIPDLSLEINNAEFFTLLGPSGCGKTTLLRMIAGFNSIEGGQIFFEDTLINDLPAHRRNIGMVFQDYAIFPHLTVEENVRYGLKRRKLPAKEANKRVEEILHLTRISAYRNRLPERLSGGQQQRVALARAIVIHPTVLLMDEPLSNLDAKLRVEMRSIIRDIQSSIGITTVYVTHDQEEALAISDRIAVMNSGVIQQVAKPRSLYSRPYNTFVEEFIGKSNFLPAKLTKKGLSGMVRFQNGYEIAVENIREEADSGDVIVAVRPEEFFPSKVTGIPATVTNVVFQGQYINYHFDLKGLDRSERQKETLEFSQDLGSATQFFDKGDTITLAIRANKVNLFHPDTLLNLVADVVQYEK